MAEALDGLPSVTAIDVDLSRDRFVVSYLPDTGSPEELLAAVREAGYEPKIVENAALAKEGITSLDMADLPSELNTAFEEAKRTDRPLLIAFKGPG